MQSFCSVTESRFVMWNTTMNIDFMTILQREELKKFKELLDMGAITQEEFEEKKKENQKLILFKLF